MKNISKRVISVILSLVLIVSTAGFSVAFAADASGGFTIENGVLTKYTGTAANVTIPSGVTKIGNDAFNGCKSLASVAIPNSVTEIGFDAFYGCESLASVAIPSSVTSIGDSVFYGCTRLASITIPDSVKSIGDLAFEKTAIYNNASNWSNNVLYIGYWLIKASNEISGNYSIELGTQGVAEGAFYSCTGLTSVTIPNSVTLINANVFLGCTGLTSVTIQNGAISDGEFWDCTSLASITISNSVTSIGRSAFDYCTGLKSITIPNSVKSIGGEAFYNCTGLTSITIPNSVTSIGICAFYCCTGLTSVTIPDSVTSIGETAFLKCKSLKGVTIPKSVNFIGNKAFGYDDETTRVDGFTITGATGSAAETYAHKEGFAFVVISHTHIPGEWIIDKAATCAAEGSKHQVCSECGATIVTAAIPKTTTHTPGEWIIDKVATCAAEGLKHQVCSVCGATIATAAIPKTTTHTPGEWIIDKAATCAAEGLKHQVCSVCGTTIATAAIPKTTTHTPGEWIIDKAATCTTEGSKHQVCSVCGETRDTETIPKAAHNYVNGICSVCGDWQNKSATLKLGSISNAENGVNISWNKVAGAGGYYVYRMGADGNWHSIGKNTSGSVTSFKDKNVKSGVTYQYTVRAFCGSTLGGYSKTGIKIQFLATPKVTVSNSVKGIRISWSASSGATGYRVYYRSGKGWAKLCDVKAGTTSVIDSAVRSGSTYTYTVKALVYSSVSGYTSGASVKFLSAPSLKSVKKTSSGLTVYYGKVSGAAGYIVYRKTSGSSWSNVGTVKSGSTTAFTDKSAKKGVKYIYTVRAYNGSARSDYYSGINGKR